MPQQSALNVVSDWEACEDSSSSGGGSPGGQRSLLSNRLVREEHPTLTLNPNPPNSDPLFARPGSHVRSCLLRVPSVNTCDSRINVFLWVELL